MGKKNSKKEKEKQKREIGKKIFERYEEMLDEIYKEASKEIYDSSFQVVGLTVLAQYDRLIEMSLEKITEINWNTVAEKRSYFLRLLGIDTVEQMYQFVQTLEEMQEEQNSDYPYRYHHYSYEEDTIYGCRQEIQDEYIGQVSKLFAQKMLKEVKSIQPKLLRRLKITDDEIIAFLEDHYDNPYEWMEQEIEAFDSLYYEVSYCYSDFHSYPSHKENAAGKIQQELNKMKQALFLYDKELELIFKELQEEKTKQQLDSAVEKILLKETLMQTKAIMNLLGKSVRNPNKLQKFLTFIEEYEQKEWIPGDIENIFLFVAGRNQVFNPSKKIYRDFLNTRATPHELEEELYDTLKEEIIMRDAAHLENTLKKAKTTSLQQLVSEDSKEITCAISTQIELFLKQITALKTREEKWIRDVLGASVFETYKKNHPQRIIIHVGLTNTGKTYGALQRLKEATCGVYLAPLRLLALEIFERLNREGIRCSLKTGEEEKITAESTHVSSTVEMCKLDKHYDIVVIDECQMVGDEERGNAWVRAILGAKTDELHLITAPEGLDILKNILNDKALEIRKYKRDTELEILSRKMNIRSINSGDAVIVFSRLSVLKTAKMLENKGFRPAIIYGSMPPSVRQKQVDYFQQGEFDVVVATDAIGMGMNLPIKRVLFMETSKFDGKQVRALTTSELRQIGGRAGRKGIFNIGYVGFMENEKQAKEQIVKEPQQIKKVVISPTFEMFQRFVDALEIECEVEALELFIFYWRTYKPNEEFVQIHEMKQQLALVHYLQPYEKKRLMTLEQIWRFVHIPIHYDNNSLIDVWKKNIKSMLIEKAPYELSLDDISHINELDILELIYKKIDVHLSFCEDGDVKHRYYDKIKEEIAEKIFVLLTKRIKYLTKKCKYCQKRLSLTYEYPMCQSCYEKRYHRNDYHDIYY